MKQSFLPRLSAAMQRKARATLKKGGLLAYATESCYGLGGHPFNHRALKRILHLKSRPKHKGLIVIAADFAQLQTLIHPLDEKQKARLSCYWPGPHTLLLKASSKVPALLRGKHHKIAVRVTAHGEAAALCKALGSALVSTSANAAGKKSLKSANACRMVMGQHVQVLPGKIGRAKTPSRIIDLETGAILR